MKAKKRDKQLTLRFNMAAPRTRGKRYRPPRQEAGEVNGNCIFALLPSDIEAAEALTRKASA